MARRFSESELMSKPPLWIKLFVWMLLKANKTDGYKGLKIGQFRTNINEMRAAMTYYAGASPRTPSIKQIRVIYESLTKGTTEGTAKGLTKGRAKGTDNNAIIKITKVRGGMLISILNYEKYQEPKNYERQDNKPPKKTHEGQGERPHEGQSEKFTKSQTRAHLISKQEEYKKNKEIYKYISPQLIDFVGDFIFHIHDQKGNLGPDITKSFIENSFNTVLSLIRIDGFDFDYIHKVIRFAGKDKFWKENLLSLATLRTKSKSNQLKKFINIANKYESQKLKKGGINGQNYSKNDTRTPIIEKRLPEYE